MSTITKERLKELAAGQSGLNLRIATPEESMELARIALASLEAEKIAEPVAKVETVGVCWYADNGVPRKPAVGTELYSAPPAPVVPADLHPDTQKLVTDFCTALAEKLYKAQLKYGYDADWKQDGWPSQCQAHFQQHIAKGDPRDVAAYCAFMWYHGWKTEPAPVIHETADREMLKRLAVILSGSDAPGEIRSLTVTARSFVDRCKTLAKERDECRAAMLQGAEPVTTTNKLPEGWVAVTVDATRAMIDAARRVEEDGYDAMHKAMIAAAPLQEVKQCT